jgi:shikimate kinase
MTAPDVAPAPGRIFLVGLMGAGKSVVGAQLAAMLGRAYRDNDTLLQQQTGLDAPTLAEIGRSALHAQECRQLRAMLVAPPPFVAGVAASVADHRDDLALLVRAGQVVYLRASPATLAQRVGRGEGRPFLGQDGGRTLRTLRAMFDRRDPVLRELGLVVDTDGRHPGQIATELAHRFTPPGPGPAAPRPAGEPGRRPADRDPGDRPEE